MLRGNLSTRPFYNERAVTIAIALVALLVLLLTVVNAFELRRLSTERQRLQAVIERDQAEATRIRARTTDAQREADAAVLARLAGSTREANDLIDRRTFSWTSFLGLIEHTLPLDVRLVDVSPRVEQGTFRVSMTVIARDLSDLGTFIDALRDTAAFRDVAAVDQQTNEDGTYGGTVEAVYVAVPASTNGAAAR
jgi:hypothetical protein